jgi:hypothetical protein
MGSSGSYVQLQASAWDNVWQGDDTPRNRDAGGCNNDYHEVSRHRKGKDKKGNRRHWCVSSNGKCDADQGDKCTPGDHIRYNASRQGHNPCKGARVISFIGGGVDGDGDQKDFTGRTTDFQNANFGLKCSFKDIDDAKLREWYNGYLKKDSGVKGNRGDGGGEYKWRSIWEQALFGIKTSALTESRGYCLDTANLMKDVGGGTCYEKIKDEISTTKAEAEAREWCKTNRSDPKCKCVNVVEEGGTNFINHCKGKFEVYPGKPKARFIWFGFDNKQDYLNIAQIEVFTGEKDSEGNMINIMRKDSKPNPDVSFTAKSGHSSGSYPPEHLNDGNYVSMFHSDLNPNEWVEVDLGKLTTIDTIKVWNRRECGSEADNNICNDRWSGAYIKLKDSFGDEVARTERIEGDHMENGKRVKTFDTFVVRDDGWSGCPEIVKAYKKFEEAGLTSASGMFGNADCLVPGICDGNVVVPTSGKPGSCANKLAICDQKVATDNIKAQNLLIEQGCEINFEADTNAPDGQTPPSTTPSTTPSPSTTPLNTSSSNDDEDEDGDEEEKAFYEKPEVQIGTVASSLISIISCFMLIILAM